MTIPITPEALRKLAKAFISTLHPRAEVVQRNFALLRAAYTIEQLAANQRTRGTVEICMRCNKPANQESIPCAYPDFNFRHCPIKRAEGLMSDEPHLNWQRLGDITFDDLCESLRWYHAEREHLQSRVDALQKTVEPTDKDLDKVADAIARTDLRSDVVSDNVCMALVAYLQDDPDCPDEPRDDESGWNPWALEKEKELRREIARNAIRTWERVRTAARAVKE